MSKKLKSLCALICTALLMLTMCFSASGIFLEGADMQTAEYDSFSRVPVYLNGEYAIDALMSGGTSYVSVNGFCEKLLGESCSLRWNSPESALIVSSGSFEFSIDLSDHYIEVSERCLSLNGNVYNVDGDIHIPIRPLAKALGAGLSWLGDGDAPSISISRSPEDAIVPGSEFYDAEDFYWLSRVIYAEAGNQPMAGMIGVGNVVLNRVSDEKAFFPDTVAGVIFQPGQFSVVDAGSIYSEPSSRSIVAAKLCLDGCSTVGDSLFFLNPSISNSAWFDANLSFRLSIGEHHFYA